MRIKFIVAVGTLIAAGGCAVKPVVMGPKELREAVRADVDRLSQPNDAISAAISLDEAIARSVRNNRDRKLKVLESALTQQQIELARHDLLPNLTAAAGYSQRSNYAASASVRFADGVPEPLPADPAYSVSQDKQRSTYDVGFTWNVLDFGLSYVRAQQQANRFLIGKERERKVVHNITQEVRAAYWRAVSAERLLQKIGPLIERAETSLSDSRKVEAQQLRPPLEALQYQRELLEILRSLQSLRQDLMNARTELAALMGLRPGTSFELSEVAAPSFQVPGILMDVTKMEEVALEQRPELLEAHYQKRISAAETRTAMLRLLPSLNLTAGGAYDSSDYLLNQSWTNAGAQVSWNLLNVFRVGAEQAVAETRNAWVDEQRLASSMAVLTQVHISRIRFDQSRKSFELAGLYNDVAMRIQDQTRNGAQAQRIAELALIRESLNALLAELRRDVAYAELQNSFGRMFMSMGMDLVPENYVEGSLADLTRDIQSRFARWQKGDLGLPAGTLPGAPGADVSKKMAEVPATAQPVAVSSPVPFVDPTPRAVPVLTAPEKPAASGRSEDRDRLRLRMAWAVQIPSTAAWDGSSMTVLADAAVVAKGQ